jgi:hypothetical protein
MVAKKRRDYESRERYMIGRRIMYAVVQCNSTQDKRTRVMAVPWESNIIQKLTEQEEEQDILSEEYF